MTVHCVKSTDVPVKSSKNTTFAPTLKFTPGTSLPLSVTVRLTGVKPKPALLGVTA